MDKRLKSSPCRQPQEPSRASGGVAYDEVLAARVRDLVPGARERSVFGARCWLHEGNLFVGVHDDDLLVRVGGAVTSTGESGIRPFDPMGSGRPMKGWLLVEPDAVAEDDALSAWVERARTFAAGLPAK